MSDWQDALEWVPTLYETIETAWHPPEEGYPGYYVSRWRLLDEEPGLLRWIHSDGETREQAVRNLIDMAPEMMLALHGFLDTETQRRRKAEIGAAHQGGDSER